MKTVFSILLIALLFFGCSKCNDDNGFLKNFKDKEHYEYLTTSQFTKEINKDDLYILNKSEAQNEFTFNDQKKYYYGYKIKLDGQTYLLSYGVKYVPLYNATFKLVDWSDTYLCIYESGKGIVSKIKTTSSDPIMSGCKEENGIYKVTSFIKIYKSKDGPENKTYFATDSIIKEYKIKDKLFEEIK